MPLSPLFPSHATGDVSSGRVALPPPPLPQAAQRQRRGAIKFGFHGLVGFDIDSDGINSKVRTKHAVKPGEWATLTVTYDGSGRAAGVSVYIDGRPAPLDGP